MRFSRETRVLAFKGEEGGRVQLHHVRKFAPDGEKLFSLPAGNNAEREVRDTSGSHVLCPPQEIPPLRPQIPRSRRCPLILRIRRCCPQVPRSNLF